MTGPVLSCTIWYMKAEGTVEIDAPAPVVWEVYSDVERWAEWTASIERIVALDSPGLEVDKRFEISQPRLPRLVWQVTAVEPGASWTWRQRSPGGTTDAVHEVTALGPNRTLVRQQIEQRGPIGVLVALAMRRRARRYLELEARGLKLRSEQLHANRAGPRATSSGAEAPASGPLRADAAPA